MPEESVEQVMTIPLRKGWDGPRQERAPHAIKTIKRYVAKHLKDPDKDGEDRTVNWEDVWIDTAINREVWARGRQHIPHYIKVKAILFEDGEVRVELAGKEDEDEEEEEEEEDRKARSKKKGEKEKASQKKEEKEEKEEAGEDKEAKAEKPAAKKEAAKPAEKKGEKEDASKEARKEPSQAKKDEKKPAAKPAPGKK
jgi:ribosomal protein L31E